MSHEKSKSQEVQAFDRRGQAFVVARQTAEAGHPANGAEAGQSPSGLRQLDDFQAKTLCSGLLLGIVTGVALVNKGHLNRSAGDSLNLLSQLAYLSTVLFVGGRDLQCQQMAQGIHRHMRLAGFAAFGSVIGRAGTTFRARLQRATVEDRHTRLFFTSRPVASRSSTRRSCTNASKTPALIQRCVC